jgi:hypothetical protein
LALPGTSANNPVWKILWQLKLPSKIKIFIWRSLHGIVPLKSILANRHVGTSGACPVCYQGAEDIRHLLFICPAAQEIWQAMELQDLIQEVVSTDRARSVILEHILRREDNDIHGFQSVSLKEVVMTVTPQIYEHLAVLPHLSKIDQTKGKFYISAASPLVWRTFTTGRH